ncbi:MAG TPA: hypothetical protein VFZ53_16695 [Polyangiaceae bacterium]
MARKIARVRSILVGSAFLTALSVAACGGSSESGSNGSGGESGDGPAGGSSSGGTLSTGGSASSSSSGGASGTSGTAGSAGSSTGGADWCSTGGCICNNGLDDDGDGLVDGLDPECTGPLDDDEGSFSTGIPGDNRDPKWQDCFFDGNSGAGDDKCRYSTDCLYGTLSQDDPDCQASQACIDYCRRLTPNGCDCFGCCTVQDLDGSELDVVIGGSCSLDTLDDESVCVRCTKTTECGNDCGECELCPGKTVDDLPDSCMPPPPPDGGTPPPPNTCDNGETVCSAEIPCPTEYFCSLGCCLPIVR